MSVEFVWNADVCLSLSGKFHSGTIVFNTKR